MNKLYSTIFFLILIILPISLLSEEGNTESTADSSTTTVTLNSSFNIDTGSQADPFYSSYLYFNEPSEADSKINKTQILGSNDYLVTPGDKYSVYYLQGTKQIEKTGIVKNDYTMTLSVFGTIDVYGMSYSDLETKIIELVSSSYPSSFPEFMIIEPGEFEVLIRGEVQKTEYKAAWGLTRLSELLNGALTEYSSIRQIKIINNENEKIVDLQKFTLLGDSSADPRLHYGDIIEVPVAGKIIELSGEVYNTGKIELIENETLKDVIEKWGGSFTPKANSERIVVKNSVFGNEKKTLYFNSDSLDNYIPRNGDQIHIFQKAELEQMVSFQGALNESRSNTLNESFALNSDYTVGEDTSNYVYYSIKEGEKISTAASAVSSYFNLTSDLAKAKIIRTNGDILEVNLENLLLKGDYSYDPELMNNDIIVIPFKQLSVYMTGAFGIDENKPYLYTVPFIAGQTYEYYVERAGGFAKHKHLGKGVSIKDRNGNKVSSKGRLIQAGDVIYASYNNPLYWMQEYSDVLAILTSTAAVTLSLYNYYLTLSNMEITPETPIPSP